MGNQTFDPQADAPTPWSVGGIGFLVDANGNVVPYTRARHEIARRVNAFDALVEAIRVEAECASMVGQMTNEQLSQVSVQAMQREAARKLNDALRLAGEEPT